VYRGFVTEMIYLFDIDGTLTAPRQKIQIWHDQILTDFSKNHKVFFVTGSDLHKVKEQLRDNVLDRFEGVFCCLGNALYQNNSETQLSATYENNPDWSDELILACTEFVAKSTFPHKARNFIEPRIGVLNVSACGRTVNESVRKQYVSWDSIYSERVDFVDYINKIMPEYEASIGGEISIDISVRGKNKSQVLGWLREKYGNEPISFFGDQIRDRGNDLPLAEALVNENIDNMTYSIFKYDDTYDLIDRLLYPRISTN